MVHPRCGLGAPDESMRVDPASGSGFAFNDSVACQMQQGTALAWMDPKTTAGDGAQMA